MKIKCSMSALTKPCKHKIIRIVQENVLPFQQSRILSLIAKPWKNSYVHMILPRKSINLIHAYVHHCSQTNYKLFKSIYAENTTSQNAKRSVQINYYIPLKDMTIQKEYLIHDFIGMLGSIGGTLGMFIGFSFLGVISSLMEYFQKLVDYWSFKKNRKNVIHIKEAPKNNGGIAS